MRATLVAAFAGLALACDEIPVFSGSGGTDPVGSSVGTGGGIVYASCGDLVDTFDAAPLSAAWQAEPAGSAVIEGGHVALASGASTLTLLAPASDCAFSFGVTPPSDGTIAFEVDDGAGTRVSVDVTSGGVSAVRYDAAGPTSEMVSAVSSDVDAVALAFSADMTSCLAHSPSSGWELVASFPREAWVDESSPRVRFASVSAPPAVVDDYGVAAVPRAIAP